MKRIIVSVIVVVILAGGIIFRGTLRDAYESFTKADLPEPVGVETMLTNTQENSGNTNSSSESASENANQDDAEEPIGNTNTVIAPKEVPAEINLAVPFTSQAPTANWDMPFQEACEEAAALMVHYYLTKQTFASKQAAESAILDIVAFQEEKYGFYKDTDGAETVRFIKEMWGYENVDLYKGAEVTLEKIKSEVAAGYPVIVLAAGRRLGNPNFTAPGPIYHALVVKGYRSDGMLITNDPGTRKGADYLYDPEVLFNAIHEWNGGDVENGEKAVIVIRP